MTYTVTMVNDWHEPAYAGASETCRHRQTDTYWIRSKDAAAKLLRELLDPPDAELTREQIQKDFSSEKLGPIEESRLVTIMNYYNGRLSIYERALKELDDGAVKNVRFDIPEDYNRFSVYEDPPPEEKMVEAYIMIDVAP